MDATSAMSLIARVSDVIAMRFSLRLHGSLALAADTRMG